jgi:hypothetical protein
MTSKAGADVMIATIGIAGCLTAGRLDAKPVEC